MKALTVQQPWAWAVLSGKINFFMEPFPPKIRGYFLIHAGISYDFGLERWLRSNGTVVPSVLQKVSLIGYARLTTVTLRQPGGLEPDRPGKFTFNLSDVKEFNPYVAAGRRGFWPVPRRMLKELDLPEHVIANKL